MTQEIESVCPAGRQQWRAWLQKNHDRQLAVWLICYKGKSAKPSVSWSDAVDEALCFGWIDSVRQSIDHEKFRQRFSKRKTISTWSKVNKKKIERLAEEGLITTAGYQAIEVAKQNGSWSMLDEVEELTIPKDLEAAFRKRAGTKKIFLNWSRSVRRAALLGLTLAKRPETRMKRLMNIVHTCAKEKNARLVASPSL